MVITFTAREQTNDLSYIRREYFIIRKYCKFKCLQNTCRLFFTDKVRFLAKFVRVKIDIHHSAGEKKITKNVCSVHAFDIFYLLEAMSSSHF